MFLIFTLLFAFSSFAAPDPESVAHSTKWLRLLHYKKSLLGNYESQADGSGFFLHTEGKHDPLAELKAAMEQFSKTPIPQDEDAACRFPARAKWLNAELGNPWKIDLSGCSRYIAFFSKVAAKRASIVFSSYYLGNPNSAFGHTLLRLSRYEDRTETEMLDYGINYSAEATASDPFSYAIKGLFGGYKGRFAALPYYYKIREYSDSEFRDLWSYDLKLTMPQVLEMVDHIWELGHTDFDYFYFLENCSYHLLALIELVVPEKNLTDKYSVFAIPADTIRLLREEDLLEDGKRRESTYSRLMRLSLNLKTASLEKAKLIVEQPKRSSELIRGMETEAAAETLDVAMEAFDYYNSDKILNDDKQTKEAKSFILRERAINPVISKEAEVSSDLKDSPAHGHAPTRYTLGEGYRHGQGKETRFQWRAAMHDLLDPQQGSLKEAQLEIGKFSLSYKEKSYSDPGLVLQDLTVLSLKNYPSQSFWANPLSWEVELGMKQLDHSDCFDCPESMLQGSVGNTFRPGTDSVLLAFLLNGEFNLQNYYEKGYRIGAGPKILARWIISEKWMTALTTHYHWGNDQELEGLFELRHHFRYDLSFLVQLKGIEREQSWNREGLVGLQYFH